MGLFVHPMEFAKLQIERDISRLILPVKARLEGLVLYFTLDLDYPPYSGAFDFQLTFPRDYPFSSPRLKCLTKTFHPNIDGDGNTCLQILREGWMPSYDLNSIIVSLHCAFADLCPEEALNTEAASLYELDYPEFLRRVHQEGNGNKG